MKGPAGGQGSGKKGPEVWVWGLLPGIVKIQKSLSFDPLSLLEALGLLSMESNACWEGPVDPCLQSPWPHAGPAPSFSPLMALVPISPQPRTPRPLPVRPETFWFELLAAFTWNLGKNI